MGRKNTGSYRLATGKTLKAWEYHAWFANRTPIYCLMIQPTVDGYETIVVGPDGPVTNETACMILGSVLHEVNERLRNSGGPT